MKSGRFFAQGFAIGIEEEAEKAIQNAARMAQEAVAATKATALIPSIQVQQMAYATPTGGTQANESGPVYNVYINGARINDDTAINSKFQELLTEVVRKGLI